MLPSILLLGFLLGRWWKIVVAAAAVAWPLLLVADGVRPDAPLLLGGALVGAVNAAVGAAIWLGLAAIVSVAVKAARRP